jgi:hypothetical protein
VDALVTSSGVTLTAAPVGFSATSCSCCQASWPSSGFRTAGVSTFVLDDVDDFTVADSRPVSDTHFDHVDHDQL